MYWVFRQSGIVSIYFVICNSDINTIKMRSSSLTWYEEWFLHCEYQWGWALTCISDVKTVYEIRKNNPVITTRKYDIELSAVQSWPIYASYDEDIKSRNAKWGQKYKGQ